MLNQEARPGPVPAAEGRRHVDHGEILRLFRGAVQEDVAAHLAAGDPVFSCGLEDETGKLFIHMLDGRRIEVRRRPNGNYERIASAHT